MHAEGTVFIVDDDDAFRDSLHGLLESSDFIAESYGSAEAFLDAHHSERPGCLILDIRMPGMTGIELQEKLAREDVGTPVIIISGHGEVETAVRAMQTGAVDFIKKPYDVTHLLDRIHQALQLDARMRREKVRQADVDARLSRLTPREREVMQRLASGQTPKEIAFALGVSRKTVDVHRGHIMAKLGIDSLIDLARMVQVSGFTSPPVFPAETRSGNDSAFV